MMRKITGTLLLAAVMTVPFAKASAKEDGIAKGNVELSMFGSYDRTTPETGPETSNTQLGGGAGYFILKPLEVGTAFFVVMTKTEASGTGATATTASESSVSILSPFVKWHFFPNPKIVPYVGTGFTVGGITSSSAGRTSTLGLTGFGLSGGANFFVKENLALSPELAWTSQSISGSGVSYSASNIRFLVSVKVYL